MTLSAGEAILLLINSSKLSYIKSYIQADGMPSLNVTSEKRQAKSYFSYHRQL